MGAGLRIYCRADRVEECRARGAGFLCELGLRPGAVDRDHQTPRWVDVNLLAMNAKRIERAVIACPPLVAIATAGLANAYLLARGGFEPAVRYDRLAINSRAIKNELAQAGIVARGGLYAAPAVLMVTSALRSV